MSTFLDLATDSLTSIGQLGTGQSASPEMVNQALRVANRILQKWSTQRLFIYTVAARPFTMVAGQQDYTLGPTVSPSPIAFVGSRPVFVESAQAVLPGSAMDEPVSVVDAIKWGAIRDKGATTSLLGLPQTLWPEYTYPNLAFHLWPIPNNSCVVKLKTWELLQQFLTVFDTVSLPPGYEQAITTVLGVELAPYYDMTVSQGMLLDAQDAVSQIKALNAQTIGAAFESSQTLMTADKGNPVEGETSPPTANLNQ